MMAKNALVGDQKYLIIHVDLSTTKTTNLRRYQPKKLLDDVKKIEIRKQLKWQKAMISGSQRKPKN
jgi:hypothetical protein